MKTILNIIYAIGFIGCVIAAIGLHEWTGLYLGGLLVFPAAACLFKLIELNNCLPDYMKK